MERKLSMIKQKYDGFVLLFTTIFCQFKYFKESH